MLSQSLLMNTSSLSQWIHFNFILSLVLVSISLKYLEEEIKKQALKRIELGVFECNKNAHKLYQKLGYQEIGKNKQFTFYQDKMWDDIRMEKYT